MSKAKNTELYYYADGKKVSLQRYKNRFAIPESTVKSGPTGLRKYIGAGKALSQGFLLVNCESLPAQERETLSTRADAQPVFQSSGTYIIPLPEVRVEDDQSSKIAEMHAWLQQETGFEVDLQPGGRLTIRPKSHKGVDAIRVAAQLNERFHPAMAQPRFIRISSRPDRTTKQ